MNNDYSKTNRNLIALPLIIFMLSAYLFKDQLLGVANQFRFGLYAEHIGFYRSATAEITYIPMDFNLNSLVVFFKSYINFIVSPIRRIDNIYLLIIGFETLCIYLFIFKSFYQDIRIKKLNRIVKSWIIILSGYFGLYCVFIYNAGQLTRYRYVLLLFVLIGYELHKKITLDKKIR